MISGPVYMKTLNKTGKVTEDCCNSIGLPVYHVSMHIEFIIGTWMICEIMVMQFRVY